MTAKPCETWTTDADSFEVERARGTWRVYRVRENGNRERALFVSNDPVMVLQRLRGLGARRLWRRDTVGLESAPETPRANEQDPDQDD